MSEAGPITSTHLWLCDRDGSVFVLKNAGVTIDFIRAQCTPSSASTRGGQKSTAVSPPDPRQVKWSKVEGGAVRLDEVVCGHSGVVLGRSLSPSILYIRRGVTGGNPLGESWSKCLCSAKGIAVGTRWIVRGTASGHMMATSVEACSTSRPVFMPAWTAIPPCDLLETFTHFALDARDNVYIVAPTGVVYGYFFLGGGSSEGPKERRDDWRLVAKAPKVPQGRRFSLFGLWRRDNDAGEMFSRVCAGSRSLWCLCREGGELWQLVLGEVGSEVGGEVRTNWDKFELPKGDAVLQLCADKVNAEVLYSVNSEDQSSTEGDSIVSYSVLHNNAGRLLLGNPPSWSRPWKSITVCHTETGIQTRAHLSIYPSLPREDFDICCENGDCEFCRRKAQEKDDYFAQEASTSESLSLQWAGAGGVSSVVTPLERWSREVGWREEKQGMRPSRVGRKRQRQDEGEEEEETYLTSMAYQPKRARQVEEERCFLLEGVEVKVREDLLHGARALSQVILLLSDGAACMHFYCS